MVAEALPSQPHFFPTTKSRTEQDSLGLAVSASTSNPLILLLRRQRTVTTKQKAICGVFFTYYGHRYQITATNILNVGQHYRTQTLCIYLDKEGYPCFLFSGLKTLPKFSKESHRLSYPDCHSKKKKTSQNAASVCSTNNKEIGRCCPLTADS